MPVDMKIKGNYVSPGFIFGHKAEFDRDIRRMEDNLYVSRVVQSPGRTPVLQTLKFDWVDHEPATEIQDIYAVRQEGAVDDFLVTMAQLAWKRGWRPEGLDNTTTQRHLEDVRTIAFQGLNMKAP